MTILEFACLRAGFTPAQLGLSDKVISTHRRRALTWSEIVVLMGWVVLVGGILLVFGWLALHTW